MRYLITGGAGFIGSHLAERLLAEPEGHTVIVLDDLSAGSPKNLGHCFKAYPGRIRIVEHPAGLNTWTGDLVGDADFVFHLAARAGVANVMKHGVTTIASNCEATEAVLRRASFRHIPVLYASSSEVYGCNRKVPFHEDDPITLSASPRWSYAASKFLGEQLALAHFRERKLPVIVTRIFNTVGPRQCKAHQLVLSSFVHAAVRGEPLKFFGGQWAQRSFCHVADTVEALIRLSRTPAAFGQIVNVGNPKVHHLIGELASLVGAQLEVKPELRLVDTQEAYGPGYEDTPNRLPDCNKLFKLTGFEAQYGLERMISDIAEEARAEFAAEQEEARKAAAPG